MIVETNNSADVIAFNLLRMVAEHPGQMGRLRAARIIGGYPVPWREPEDAAKMVSYAVSTEWRLRELVDFVDVMLDSGLLAATAGPRPSLVLTRAGFRALEAIEAGDAQASVMS